MKPQTKETAILMLVDSIEAASRTVDRPIASKFEQMIQRILFTKLKQGQLDESGLDMADLRIISNRHGRHAGEHAPPPHQVSVASAAGRGVRRAVARGARFCSARSRVGAARSPAGFSQMPPSEHRHDAAPGTAGKAMVRRKDRGESD
jgi:hypothetical protein